MSLPPRPPLPPEEGGPPVDDGPERPMLVIGQRHEGPEVQDTTPEELARRAEELRREQREAQAEIERLRQQTEAELAAKQAELDQAEKRLYRTEARLQQRARGSGQALPDLVTLKELRKQRSPRHPLHTTKMWATALAAGVLIVLTGVFAGGGEDPGVQVEELTSMVQARTLWDQAGLVVSQEALQVLAGQDIGSEGPALASSQLVAQAVEIREPSYRFVIQGWEEGTERLVQLSANQPVQVLTVLDDLQDRSRSGVSGMDVRRTVEELEASGGATLAAALVGAALLLILLGVAVRAREPWAIAALVLATLSVLALVWVSTDSHRGALADAAQDHLEVHHHMSQVTYQVHSDLSTALGSRNSSSRDPEEFWSEQRFVLYSNDTASAQAYREAHRQLGLQVPSSDTDDPVQQEQALLTAAEQLVTAGQEVMTELTQEMTTSLEGMQELAAATRSAATWQVIGLSMLALGLTAGAQAIAWTPLSRHGQARNSGGKS